MNDQAKQDLKQVVRERYGTAVRGKLAGKGSSCCGSAGGSTGSCDPITSDLYDATQAGDVPADALAASFGCGNPTALAELRAGEVVLDLGSGGGIDVLLSAKRVAPGGKAYGLDMTDEMLAVARENQRKAGVDNVEFLKGEIESIPLPDASVDVIVSNCVINLSGDKDRVLREAFRVLRPGGRFAVSDIVLHRELTGEVKRSMELYTGCIAGALVETEYARKLVNAGFVGVTITPTREFGHDEAKRMVADAGIRGPAFRGCVDALDGAVFSGFIRATKPR
ncbi:MAG: arsenite methyltransferase [Planctomycetes bacterium]|nr:arsenite methyltransferase [Planctomycetota bacterium]